MKTGIKATDNEVDIAIYFSMIMRYRKVFIFILVLFTMVGALSIILSPVRYSLSAVLSIGLINDYDIAQSNYVRQMISASAVISRLTSRQQLLSEIEAANISAEAIKRYRIAVSAEEIFNTPYITLKVSGIDVNTVSAVFRMVIDNYLKYGHKIYLSEVDPYKTQISQLDVRMSDLQSKSSRIIDNLDFRKARSKSVNPFDRELNSDSSLLVAYELEYDKLLFNRQRLYSFVTHAKDFGINEQMSEPSRIPINYYAILSTWIALGVFIGLFIVGVMNFVFKPVARQ
jgi:hypothetical protein